MFYVILQIRTWDCSGDAPDKNHAEINKVLGRQWKELSHNEQQKYREASKALKVMHVAEFPSYKYKPIRKRRCTARKMKPAPKRPLQSETLEQEPLQPETLEQEPLQPETLVQEPLQPETLEHEPLQHELMQPEPQSYLAPLLDDQELAMLCEPTKHDVKDIIKTFEDYLQVLQTKTSRHQNVNNLEIIYCLRFA